MKEQNMQQLIDEEVKIEATVRALQAQIDSLQTRYVERSWQDGNVLLGWTKNITPTLNKSIKIRVSPRDKIFSLSSTTSPVYRLLAHTADKNLVPVNDPRFEPKKKKRHAKRNCSLARRPKLIRKRKHLERT